MTIDAKLEFHGVPVAGSTIGGKYLVEEVLGRGGMGVVVAARHMALRQRVALKLLLPEALRIEGASARFLREAQAAAAIQSEHVSRILDVGALENGTPYIVMEYLSGIDLGKLRRQRGRLPVAEAVDYVLQASEAIAEAHALGIVHRDLKPSNLFLVKRASGAPMVKVLDFGLSKVESVAGKDNGEPNLTSTHLVAGSPHYMSPEQIRSLKHVDARTDVWALGVILFELLAGRHPFEGENSVSILASIVADPPIPMSEVGADVPVPLQDAVARCLEKDPAKRMPTVAALMEAIAPFRDRASSSRAPSIPGPLDKTAPLDDTLRSAIPSAVERSAPGSGAAWGNTQLSAPRRRADAPWVLGIAVAALVLVGGAAMWGLRARPAPHVLLSTRLAENRTLLVQASSQPSMGAPTPPPPIPVEMASASVMAAPRTTEASSSSAPRSSIRAQRGVVASGASSEAAPPSSAAKAAEKSNENDILRVWE